MGIITEFGEFLEKKEGRAFIILVYLVLFYLFFQTGIYFDYVLKEYQKKCCEYCNSFYITNESIFYNITVGREYGGI